MFYLQREGIVTREFLGRTVLIDIHSNDYFRKPKLLQLNEMGAFIWRLLEKRHSLVEVQENVIAELVGEFDRNIVIADISGFISKLVDSGYVVEEE